MQKWEGLHSPRGEISLKKLHWDAKIEGLYCRLNAKQHYINTSEEVIEAVYTFAIPRTAVVTDFAMVADDKRLVATLMPKAQAEMIYEEAVEDGDMPAMLEMADDGICTANIGTLNPHEEVVIEITYEWMLTQTNGLTRLTIPTVIGDRYSSENHQGQLLPHQEVSTDFRAEYPITARVEFVGNEYKTARIHVPNHSPVVMPTETGMAVEINSGFADASIVVTAQVAPIAQSLYVKKGDFYHRVISLPIPSIMSEPKNLKLKVLVDCSGSMTGAAIEEAKRSLHSLKGLMGPNDQVTLSCFGSECLNVIQKLTACTASFWRRDWSLALEGISATMGATEMGDALRSVAALSEEIGDILLITDGEVWEEKPLVALAKTLKHRLFVIGVGYANNENLCAKIAAATGGACECVMPSEDMESVVERMIARMRVPALTCARVNFGNKMLRPFTVFSADTMTVMDIVEEKPKDLPEAIICFEEKTYEVKGSAWQQLSSDGLVKMTVSDAIRNNRHQFDPVDYQVLTPETSFVLVNVRDEKTSGVPKLQKIPQMMTRLCEFAPMQSSCAPSRGDCLPIWDQACMQVERVESEEESKIKDFCELKTEILLIFCDDPMLAEVDKKLKLLAQELSAFLRQNHDLYVLYFAWLDEKAPTMMTAKFRDRYEEFEATYEPEDLLVIYQRFNEVLIAN